nr:PREDICTED: uncharacterized protein LOC102350285 isoform X3 [Latimeria chalumnae]|eukprot:XP_014349475.1 PREDICTED: uncharacterized protein LOC102350285 isoform X3 [Latimeria chalumnae]
MTEGGTFQDGSSGNAVPASCCWCLQTQPGSLVIPERRCALKEESIPFPAILPSFLGNLLLQTDGKYYPVSLLCGACCSGDGICSKAQPTRSMSSNRLSCTY